MQPKASPLSLTLDTNCLIDVAEERPAAIHIRALLAAASEGRADLALVASSASERQQSGGFLHSVDAFNERRTALGFGDLPLLPSISRYGVSFFGHALWSGEELRSREHLIYRALFPSSPVEWIDYAAAKGAAVEAPSSPAYRRWRNQMLDAQALWAHDHAGRDVFVTSDQRFKTLEGRADFPTTRVRTPEEAAARLGVSRGTL